MEGTPPANCPRCGHGLRAIAGQSTLRLYRCPECGEQVILSGGGQAAAGPIEEPAGSVPTPTGAPRWLWAIAAAGVLVAILYLVFAR